jgi:hypothetical protein
VKSKPLTLLPLVFEATTGKERVLMKDNELDTRLDEEQTAELILEVEAVLEAIKSGEIDGEYFEF